MGPGFLLSHHAPSEHHRCYRLGPVHVCARCLGVYPVLFAVVALQLALHAPLAWDLDLPVALALTAPALLDWSLGQLDPSSGTNPRRTLTGVFLGLGLGRTLYIHLLRPLPTALLAQLGLVIVVVPLVILAAYLRRPRG